jgi:hypothetical protein
LYRYSVAALEHSLKGARHALDGTHALSPCAGCSRDAAAAQDASARARTAEARADALAVEVHTLRAMAIRRGASERDVDAAATHTTITSYGSPSAGGAVQVQSSWPHSLKVPGFNPRAYQVKNWFQILLFSNS